MRLKVALLGCVIVWGWTFVATKVALEELSPVGLLALRFVIGMPILWALLRLGGGTLNLSSASVRPLGLAGGIIVAHFLLQAYALRLTTATNTGWIITVTPLATAVLAWFLLKERITTRQIVGIALATLGVLTLMSRGDVTSFASFGNPGDWMILISAVTWALYTIASRDISRRMSPLAVSFWVFAPLTIISLALVVYSREYVTFDALSARVWVATLFLGVAGTVTQWVWQVAVARLGASNAGVYLYLEPVATTVLAVPLLRESVNWATALGAALTLGGVWWAQRRLSVV